MNEQQVLGWIKRCKDDASLRKIRSIANARMHDLAIELWNAKKEQKWLEAKQWKVGQKIYCCASGTFIGGPIQRGDAFVITYIQPCKRVVWCSPEGEKPNKYGFPVSELARYDMQLTPPANSISPLERKIVEKLGGII